MACKENQVEENVSSMLQRQIEEYRIVVEGRQIEEYGIDVWSRLLKEVTLKGAETIVNFISADYEDRRIRDERVWCNDILRREAYFRLSELLEEMCQSTPLSIAGTQDDLAEFSCLLDGVKVFFEGAWLDELVRFLHENEKYLWPSEKDLKLTKKHQKNYSERLTEEVKVISERRQETHDQLQQIKAQIEEAKKANRNGDGLEELERSEQSLREDLEIYDMNINKLVMRLKGSEAILVKVRNQLKLGRNARAKLAALEFDIFSPTIIRNKVLSLNISYLVGQDPNLTGDGLHKKNGDAGLVKMIPTMPHGEEGSYWSYGH